VVATLGLVNLPSQILPIDSNLSAVILLIGLAVGVDYSRFDYRLGPSSDGNGHD
jgi:hypothetical protein